jgi:hypothetical protein
MEPRQDIRFCKTSDGVRIATATTRSGPVMVRVGTWCSHLECDLREPESWVAIQEFGCAHTFVRYDPRGCGMFVSQLLGTKAPGLRGSIDERMRLSMTPEMAEQYLRVNYSMNVKAECALLQCPVLVLHARDDQMVGFEQGLKLAAWIPGARFVPLDSDSHDFAATPNTT